MENRERKRAGAAVMSVRNLNIKAARISNLSTPINEILVGGVVFWNYCLWGIQNCGW